MSLSLIKRQVFYSLHYKPDCWRAAQVRSIGSIQGNHPAPDNDWSKIVSLGDDAVTRWIRAQMKFRSCTIVLVGSNTANRKWIDFEIKESWRLGMGVAGISIHGLKNSLGEISLMGKNPFDSYSLNGQAMTSFVKCYDPPGRDSKERYSWIANNIASIADEAVRIRQMFPK